MSPQRESNTRPIDYNGFGKPLQSIALPTEL